ncbi:unnamed protein product [Rotaria magnacalcarata]|uniref:Uncharacterized protein n=1 Tax=Rotaria magnacalcarata TaxID=392030 RepID=A0A816X7V3_9BILA|nr:unnamed protein product [Rotaria magnacalcarata]CAF2143553.1 unnamed protein product [Rotaria magnacalcarata]CAF4217030.1 unnamed protein product [Rotaria magnacalcarata]CAF4217291.1 unnamed protein product [Rotaria magnacalcarata]
MFVAEVETTISDAVCEQRLNLQKMKQLIFKELHVGEQPNVADVKLVETYYIKVLLECARMEVEQCFDACCEKKYFVNNFARHSDKIMTIGDIKVICESEYYVTQLELYSNLIDAYDLASFITNLKADLWRKILEVAKDGFKELEMLHYLTVCFQMNMISPAVQTKLVEFKNGLAAQSRPGRYLRVLMKTIPTVENSTSQQLQKFLRSVKYLESDYLFLETQLLSLINFYLKPIEISIENLGNRSIVEIISGIIYVPKIVPKIEQILQDEGREKRIDEVRFIALYMLDIDYDLKNSHWHGFNILVMAAKVNVSKKCEWNLSGVSSRKYYEKASSGSSCGNDGQDGKDGYCGESSGNVMILAEEMHNAHNLTVTLNGGDGSGGQEGGDGANGQDGTGTTMSELKKEYPSPIHLSLNQDVATLFNKISSKGKGSKGEQGGRGGLNGLGGDRGFQGECFVVSKENKSFPVHIKRAKGSKGQNAKPDRTGEYGKNGWDVGYTDYVYWTRADEFGAGHNQRLTMNYSASSSDRVYCGYRYDALGSSACYTTIKASMLEHRKLADSEKLREIRKEGKRRKEAVATRKNVMRQKAMEKTYGKYFETGDCLMKTVAEMRAENMMNFNMMHRKAKQAFEEVESLKERSREKVGTYRIYEVTKKDKAVRKQNNPGDAFVWMELCDEEFSIDELGKGERHFNNFRTQRTFEIAEISWIPRKFGLARFCGITNDAYQLEINQNMNLNRDFNSEKYLKISEQSYSDLEWLGEFQDETLQNRNIEDTFHDLCQYRLSTSDLNIVEANYSKLVSIKMGTETLEEFLSSWQTDDNQSFTKLSTLKGNKTEWEKVLEVFHCFGKYNLKSEVLKNNVPLYDEKELKKENDLLKYLFGLWNSLYTLKTTNTTLAKMIEWLIIENGNFKNPPSQIQEYLKLEKNSLMRNQTH